MEQAQTQPTHGEPEATFAATTTAYQFDPATGRFAGFTVADLSPLEPGIYLVPASATLVAPPQTGPGQYVVFRDEAWHVEAEPLPDPETLEEAQKRLQAFVQLRLDRAAQALGYDDIKTAVTYADEPVVPLFEAQGKAFRRLRSLTWAACYALLAQVHAGTRPVPTEDELAAELPALEIPS